MGKGFSVRSQPGFVFVAMLCFFLLYLPIATLVFYAFNAGVSVAVWEGFSLRWFQSAMNNIRGAGGNNCARYSSR